jgi:nitrate/nitrite transporter NarK
VAEKILLEGQKYLYQPYRWVMMILIGLVQLVAGGCIVQVAALGSVIIKALGLTTAQFGSVVVVSFLAGAIFGIPCGALADRYGSKTIIGVGLIIGAIGGICRIYTNTYATLFLTMFLIGLIIAALNAVIAKVLALWFHPVQMNIVMSVYVATATLGAALALFTTPLILSSGGTIQTIYTYGAMAITIVTVLWLLFAKEKPVGSPDIKREPVTKYISEVIMNKQLWISSTIMFLLMGALKSTSTFLIVGLTEVKGIDMLTAGAWGTLSSVLCLIGIMIVPAFIEKIGWMKGGYITVTIIVAVTIAFGWSMPYSTGSMAIVMVGYTLIGAGIPIHKQYPALLPGIKSEAVGTAGGIQSTLQNLGAYLLPSYILGTIAGPNISMVFYGIAVLLIISAILTLFLPEVGWRANKLINRNKTID